MTVEMDDEKNNFTFTHEPRNWVIKLVLDEQWTMLINDTKISDLPEAPKNERAIEEIHKSETLPNYTDTKK